MNQPDRFDADALLLGHSAGELTAEEQRALFEAAAADQELFALLMNADALRHALSVPGQGERVRAVLQAWDEPGSGAAASVPETAPYAALDRPSSHRRSPLLTDLLRSVLSTAATTVA